MNKIIIVYGVMFAMTLFPIVTLAKAYKCSLNGAISYQSSPCKKAENTEEMDVKVNKTSLLQACLSSCDSRQLICVSKLEDGGFNTDGGLKVCTQEKEWCEAKCNGADEIELIKKKHAYNSAKRGYKLKKDLSKISEDAKNRKKKRVSEWHEKRKQEIVGCITKGMVELDALKVRSEAWKREKVLKASCKKKARSEVYGRY